MKNALKHKGYIGRVEFDPDDCLFVGRICGIEDSVGFHSDTAEGLVAAFRAAVEDYLETCAKAGKKPDKPYSGTVSVRVGPAIHAKLAIAAEMAGKSLNQFSADALRRAVRVPLAAKAQPEIDRKSLRAMIAERFSKSFEYLAG